MSAPQRLPPGRIPTWARWLGGLWLLLIGAWMPALVVVGQTSSVSKQSFVIVFVLSGAVVVLSTIAWGATMVALIGWLWVLLAACAGTAVLMASYIVAMLATNDPGADIEAGAGIVVLSIPGFVTVGVLLALGGGIGSLVRRRPRRSAAPY